MIDLADGVILEVIEPVEAAMVSVVLPDAVTVSTVTADLILGSTDFGQVYPVPSPSASWIITHTMGRLPNVAIYVGGELVEADVFATETTVNVAFSVPHSGYLVLT